jgi:hypothetical protein
MRTLRNTALAVAALLLVTASVALARSASVRQSGTLGTLKASSYSSNGDTISGWNWLRAYGHTATWTFDVSSLQNARQGTVYLNLSALATKGVSGGSGWSGSLNLAFTGRKTMKTVILLDNPFRPRTLSNTSGVGYQVYGATRVPARAYLGADTMTITAVRSRASIVRNIHVALNQNAAVIGYLER